MLARLGTGIALASMTALVLVGCSPPEPALSDDEVLARASESLESFYATVEQQYERGEANAADFEGITTSGFAEDYAAQLQEIIDDGATSEGAPILTAIELIERGSSSAQLTACLDATSVRTETPDGEEVSGQFLAWQADFDVSSDGEALLLSDIEVSMDQNSCLR